MKLVHVQLTLGLLACLPLASYGVQDVQARFEKSMKDAKSVGKLEIEFLDTLWMPNGIGPIKRPFSRTIQYSYITSGMKHRARSKVVSATETNLAKLFESAFDGKSFSSFDGDNRYMTRMTRNSTKLPIDSGQSAFNPLIAPFMFLTKHSDDCIVCALHFTDLVSMTDVPTLPKGQWSGGVIELSVGGLSLMKQPTTWRIALDETSDSFTPKTISQVVFGQKREVLYKLLNYTNLGAYQFPARIEHIETSYPPTSPPTVLSTGLVTVVSALIPDQIEESVFRLDSQEKSAAVIWDWDQRKLIRSAPRAHVPAKTVRNIFLLFLFITAPFTFLVVKKLSSKI